MNSDLKKENSTNAGEPVKRRRNLVLILVSIFLIIAIVSTLVITGIIGTGAYLTAKGAQGITEPISDLVKKLVIEATPEILPNPVVIVEEIKGLARLETSAYSFQDILQIERNRDVLWGALGETLLFVAYGDVIAGVDLNRMNPEDFQVLGPAEAVVHLPAPEIFLVDLDNERSYVANRDIGLLTRGDPGLETMVRQQAEERMLEAAMEGGILENAEAEAERVIRSFLGELGFRQVTFVDEPPPPATPYVQEVPKGYALTPAPTATVSPKP